MENGNTLLFSLWVEKCSREIGEENGASIIRKLGPGRSALECGKVRAPRVKRSDTREE